MLAICGMTTEKALEANERVQWVKTLNANSRKSSWIPGTYMVEEDFHKLYSDHNTHCGTHNPTHMYIHPKQIRNPPSYTHYMTSASSPSLELLGTQRVGDVLDGVTQTVCIVVGGVDAPV